MLDWTFPSGMRVNMAHLEYEKNIYDYQGAQYNLLEFDEVDQFTFNMFFYLISRIRSASGNSGYVRATCNPNSKSWVRKFIDWWIDPITGFPIPERDGVPRYFIRDGDKFIWGDSREELQYKCGKDHIPMSVTFIRSKLSDNKILVEKDPMYLSRLMSLSRVDRMQLLDGNWNVEATAGELFKRHWFEIVDTLPRDMDIRKTVRAWDRAATEADPDNPGKDPDWTVGVKMCVGKDGIFYITDLVRDRLGPAGVEKMTLNTASRDGVGVSIKIFQDPGGAGVYEAQSYVKLLAGYHVVVEKIIKDKITSAKPMSAQAERGNIKILRAPWNEDLLSELNGFPDDGHDDIVDACSSAFNYLTHDIEGDFDDHFLGDDNTFTENMTW